jgi:arylformamidase
MKFFDISMGIDENIPVYKNVEGKKPKIKVFSTLSTESSYESEIHMNLHTGTHIDMPLHMLENGETSDSLDISKLVTSCSVLDLTEVNDKITHLNLKQKDIHPGAFILLKTKNSYVNGFDPEFVFLDATGADYLVEKQITGVGIDSLGIERSQPNRATHKTLFKHGIIILEGLRLAEIKEGTYNLIALPLRINNVEALPARVLLY